MSCEKRLSNAFILAPHLPLDGRSRYVLFSDCHRGIGDSNDNFLKNQHIYFAALRHYEQNGFSYIELGDGDELWENRDMKQIIDIHSNVFWLLSRLYRDGRLHLIYGNHDMVKKYPRYRSKTCSSYFCTESQAIQPLFPDLPVHEGIILTDSATGKGLYLTHGHQADPLNSVFWRASRFLVRYLWRPLEHYGVTDPTSAAKNYSVTEKNEKRLLDWAKAHHRVLITGHTHRPRLGSADVPYFNTGSCVHPRCITCLELQNRRLTLVKWSVETGAGMELKVARRELAAPVSLDEL